MFYKNVITNMKMYKTILVSLIAMMCLQSCDKNKGKIENFTKQFVNVINEKDKASIYTIYPEAKNLPNMKIPESITDGNITIEKNKEGKYIASIDNPRQ